MLCGLPQHFRLFNQISLPKTVASGGNVRERNLKFKKIHFIGNRILYIFRRTAEISVLVILPLTD